MPFNSTTTATITSGQAVSAGVDLGEQRLAGIILPAGWDAASLSFQTSIDGTNWVELADTSGLIGVAAPAVGRMMMVDPATFYGVRWLKVRSGTAASPVNQTAGRDITLWTMQR